MTPLRFLGLLAIFRNFDVWHIRRFMRYLKNKCSCAILCMLNAHSKLAWIMFLKLAVRLPDKWSFLEPRFVLLFCNLGSFSSKTWLLCFLEVNGMYTYGMYTRSDTIRVCNSSPNFIPWGMRNMRNAFFFLGVRGMKFLSSGIPGVLRSNYFWDFVDFEGKKGVIIESGG